MASVKGKKTTTKLGNGSNSAEILYFLKRMDLNLKRMPLPHAGAWIETKIASGTSGACYVAPHAGAWIVRRGSMVVFSGLVLKIFNTIRSGQEQLVTDMGVSLCER